MFRKNGLLVEEAGGMGIGGRDGSMDVGHVGDGASQAQFERSMECMTWQGMCGSGVGTG